MPNLTTALVPITTNDDYTIDTIPGNEYAIDLSGTFGSGTITVKNSSGAAFKDTDGTTDLTATAAKNFAVIPTGRQITLTMAGSTAASVAVEAADRGKA